MAAEQNHQSSSMASLFSSQDSSFLVRTIFTVSVAGNLPYLSFSATPSSHRSYGSNSQSYQILAILSKTLGYSVVYGYRFWTGFGLPGSAFPSFVVNCQSVLVSCNLVSHAGVLTMHLIKGGCNGIGAWCLNSVLNGAILLLFLIFTLVYENALPNATSYHQYFWGN